MPKVNVEGFSDNLVPKAQRKQERADRKRNEQIEAQRRSSEFTPAQRLMRSELHPPLKAGEAVGEITGAQGGWVTDMAVDVINNGPNLNLSFNQWAVVQQLIEDGIKRGFELGQES